MIVRYFAISVAFVMAASVAVAEGPAIPNVKPLTEAEIKALLDGNTFDFQAFDMPLAGTTHWNFAAQTVSGEYVYDGQAGTYEAEWTIVEGKSCTKSPDQDRVCQTIYPYEGGFMEVTDKGVVHAVSQPE